MANFTANDFLANAPKDLARHLTSVKQLLLGNSAIFRDRKSTPLLSIIITCKDASDTLASVLTSLQLSDLADDTEILIIDDASEDRTELVVSEFAAFDGSIRYVKNPYACGIYQSRNIGIILARGKYIAFQDADDISLPSRFKQAVEKLSNNKALIYSSRYSRIDQHGNIVSNRGEKSRNGLVTMVCDRDVFNQIGYFDPVYSTGDAEFHYRVKASLPASAVHVSKVVDYFALHHQQSISQRGWMANDISQSEIALFLAPIRKRYQDAFIHFYSSKSAQFTLSLPYKEIRHRSSRSLYSISAETKTAAFSLVDTECIDEMAKRPSYYFKHIDMYRVSLGLGQSFELLRPDNSIYAQDTPYKSLKCLVLSLLDLAHADMALITDTESSISLPMLHMLSIYLSSMQNNCRALCLYKYGVPILIGLSRRAALKMSESGASRPPSLVSICSNLSFSSLTTVAIEYERIIQEAF
jgi:glycosyltransferase involved in cell wall biosynthesis